jgi:hypothetical protein
MEKTPLAVHINRTITLQTEESVSMDEMFEFRRDIYKVTDLTCEGLVGKLVYQHVTLVATKLGLEAGDYTHE